MKATLMILDIIFITVLLSTLINAAATNNSQYATDLITSGGGSKTNNTNYDSIFGVSQVAISNSSNDNYQSQFGFFYIASTSTTTTSIRTTTSTTTTIEKKPITREGSGIKLPSKQEFPLKLSPGEETIITNFPEDSCLVQAKIKAGSVVDGKIRIAQFPIAPNVPEAPNIVYCYVEITNIDDNLIENIVLTYQVENEWGFYNNIEEINAYVFNNRWNILRTKKVSSDSRYNYYEISIPYFFVDKIGVFVLSGTKSVTTTTIEEVVITKRVIESPVVQMPIVFSGKVIKQLTYDNISNLLFGSKAKIIVTIIAIFFLLSVFNIRLYRKRKREKPLIFDV